MGEIRKRLSELGIELPAVRPALGAYIDVCIADGLAFVSGKLPLREDGSLLYAGKLGCEVRFEEGYAAAELCARHILACLEEALGDLDRVRQIVRVGGFVAVADGFTDIPKVVNGASELFIKVFRDAGRHSRAAIGVAALPLGAPVEIEALAAVAP
ncbi:MAG: RidA family protein [Spirochaetota bacterium]|jgi:enamine deaminase RidA (YjgF/YER057c/UK114 family)|nr:RidA family protein [Spirochaetota bacterium]